MPDTQRELFSSLHDMDVAKMLLADLYNDLEGMVGRFHQLTDLSAALGTNGTLIFGGEVAYRTWTEARYSFVHGNYVATVMLCQGLAEHLLAARVAFGLSDGRLPKRVRFDQTLDRCIEQGLLTRTLGDDLARLMGLRNPLAHYRSFDDQSNLSRRAFDSQIAPEEHLTQDATFAISVAVGLLALPAFRIDGELQPEA